MGFQIGIKDIIDILFVAIILYETFRILKRSGAVNVFWGILAFLLAWFIVSYVLSLDLTGAIFDRIISVGAIALIVLFQDEIRLMFSHIGQRFNQRYWRFASRNTQKDIDRSIMQIVLACRNMSELKTGALIVITRSEDLNEFADTGERIDAVVSARLLENIFFKNTPLHDGAVFITRGKLRAAACILPVSKNPDIPQHYGLRHRAALGISEKSDAVAVVVSEETGLISVAQGEEIREVLTDDLENVLTSAL